MSQCSKGAESARSAWMGWATKKRPQDGEIAVHELTVALAKGRVARSVLPMFEEIGCDVAQLGEALDAGSRSLTPRDGRRGFTFLLAKADDRSEERRVGKE